MELPDVDAVGSSPTVQTYGVNCMKHCPKFQLQTHPAIPQRSHRRLHLKTIILRARVPVRIADQGLDWLKDGLGCDRKLGSYDLPPH